MSTLNFKQIIVDPKDGPLKIAGYVESTGRGYYDVGFAGSPTCAASNKALVDMDSCESFMFVDLSTARAYVVKGIMWSSSRMENGQYSKAGKAMELSEAPVSSP